MSAAVSNVWRWLSTLGLPLSRPRVAWSAVAVLSAIDFATMARDLGPYDSPELALVACDAGLSHPIGQPLHTLLGWLACRVPLVPPLVALSALSAIPSALTLVPALSIAERLDPEPDRSVRSILRAAILVLAGCHTVLWEPATRVEVYALAVLFAAWAIAKGLGAERPRDFGIAGLSCGLAAAANPWVGVMAALVVSLRLVQPRGLGAAARRIAAAIGGGVIGLVPYAWIPIAFATRRHEALVWGASDAPDALSFYLRGGDYAHNRELTPELVLDNATRFAEWSIRSGYFVLLALGVIAALVSSRQRLAGRWSFAAPSALAIGLVTTNAIYEPDVLDHLGYLALGAVLGCTVIAAVLARGLLAGGRARIGATVALLALAGSVVTAPPGLLERSRHEDRALRALVESLLDEAPPEAIAVVASDHWAASLLYVQEVEGRRPDVVLVPYGLCSSSWYWDHLHDLHPSLARAALRGPGGRAGRLRRLLEANAARPVLVESIELALEVGLAPCSVGELALVRPCGSGMALDADAASRIAATELGRVAHGSPATDEIVANVALARGLLLWSIDRPAEAYRALLSGVTDPPALAWPDGARATRLDRALPPFAARVALGDERRNLHVAALLLESAGLSPESARLAAEARRRGLPRAF